MKSTVASLLGSAALVAAHGIVSNGTIGGKNFMFYQPDQDPYKNPVPERISRAIQGNGPVEDVTSIDLQCGGATAGGGTKPAKLVAKAAAGEEVTLNWTLWPESHIGPTITYMAKCANDDCTNWLPGKEEVWFKVQEQGREGTSNNWGATPLMKAGNPGVKYTIPECIAPGQYLVRHEIIALHSASSYPGAQFYPGCHQIEVTGSGSTSPSDLVAFPGAYKSSDAGITYNAYTAQAYTIPGPKVFSCSGSGSGTVPVPPAATPTQPADDDEEDCPAETASVTSSAAASGPTAKAEDGDEDDCPVETPSATRPATPVATPTQPADDEEDCPVETPSATKPAAPAATPTQPADDDEEDCPVETPSTTSSAAASGPTAKAEDGDEDDCPVETPSATRPAAPVATPTQPADDEEDCPVETPSATKPAAPVATPTQPADDDEEDCPVETPSATRPAAPAATPTQPTGDDEDDCPAETPSPAPYAKRMTFHERRHV